MALLEGMVRGEPQSFSATGGGCSVVVYILVLLQGTRDKLHEPLRPAMPYMASKHDRSWKSRNEGGGGGGGSTKFCRFCVGRDGNNEREIRAGTTTFTVTLCRHVRDIFLSISRV